jgi:hypothetical protein
MRKKHWRQVMGIHPEEYGKLNEETIMKIMKELHGEAEFYNWKGKIERGDKFWYMDQVTISVNIVKNGKDLKLCKIAHGGDGAHRDGRHKPDSDFLQNLESKKLTDLHMFHSNVYEKIQLINRLNDVLFAYQHNGLVDFLKNYTKKIFKVRNEALVKKQ